MRYTSNKKDKIRVLRELQFEGERQRKQINEKIRTVLANCDKCQEGNGEGDVTENVSQIILSFLGN